MDEVQTILENIKIGEFKLRDGGGKSKVWNLFARILNQEDEEINDYVYCKRCGNLFRYNKGVTSNLVKHRRSNCSKYDDKLKVKARKIAQEIYRGELVLRDCRNASRCWKIFAKIEDLNGDEIRGFVQCRVCKKVLSVIKFSTTNMVRHRCYVEKYYVRNQENAVSIKESQNYVLKMITKWVVNECKPYDVIHDAGLMEVFQEFISLGAKFGTDVDIEKLLPNVTTISGNVGEMYEQCLKKVKAEIADIKDNGFGLAADIWTDSYTKQSYVAVIIHYLKNGSLTYSFLGLRPICGESLSTHNIYETTETILLDFGCELSNKSILVTNGDSDFMKTFQNNSIPNFQCISLLLHNAMKKSVEEVPEVAELASACPKLVNFCKQANIDADFISSLQSYTPSRYNTMYHMLTSIENNWSDISQILRSLNESQRIEAINISHLKAVTKTLQTFEEAIEILEEDGDATLHLVLVYLHELKKSCSTYDSEFKNFDFIENLMKNLHFHLEKILTENITILHKMALFLYPPTNKLLLFSDQEKKCIEDECKRLCLENAIKQWTQQAEKLTSTSLAKHNKLFADFVEPKAKHGPDELISQELQRYRNVYVQNSEDFDCFSWWELHKDVYPLLHKLSCCILAAPASIATAQQVFTVARSLTNEIMEFDSNQTEAEKIIFTNFNGE